MKKIELELIALSQGITPNQSFAVVLGEKHGLRRIPIVIGTVEAQAIAMAADDLKPPRPLTHDLIKNICKEFDIHLREVVINNLIEGIFYARLYCEKNNEILEIDSRSSDAIALAMRFKCPIYTYESILDQAGIVFEEPQPVPTSSKKSSATKDDVSYYSIEKLQEMMEKALEDEDYEKAARLRDEIKQRR
ncbi:MAG: bifunctional nuclease family protein [Chitinophagales bacterium]|jgi:bifunctional DNase/RNase|nr:bifunctional nuclease family protein [Chitinophagales bacterium]